MPEKTPEEKEATPTDSDEKENKESEKGEEKETQEQQSAQQSSAQDPNVQEIVSDKKVGRGFWDWIQEIQGRLEGGKEISAKDLADQFILWYEDETSRAQLEERYERWLNKLKRERGEGFWNRIHQMIRIGKGPEAYTWERIYGALLDERVKEIESANLNGGDRLRKFREIVQTGDVFESQALLLSLANTSDLTEGSIEEYYDRLSKEQEILDPDDPLKKKKIKIHLGNTHHLWFETKARREAHQRGKRPDIWQSGKRKLEYDDMGKIIGVTLKTKDEWAKGAEKDATDIAGRRSGLAAEKDHYARYQSHDEAYAASEMLKKKRDKIPEIIEGYRQKSQILKRGVEVAEAEAQKLRAARPPREDRAIILEGRAKDLLLEVKNIEERVIYQEQQRLQLINDKINRKIKYQYDEVKSMLLDPDGDETITVAGRTYKESELALQMGIRKYYAIRSQTDAGVIFRGEHVMASEAVNWLNMMSKERKDEFSWMTSHWLYGSRKPDGSYDETRDSYKNVSDLMKGGEGSRFKSDLNAYEGKKPESAEEKENAKPAENLANQLMKKGLANAYEELRSKPPSDLDKLIERSKQWLYDYRLNLVEGEGVVEIQLEGFPKAVADVIAQKIQRKIDDFSEGEKFVPLEPFITDLVRELQLLPTQEQRVREVLEQVNLQLDSVWGALEKAEKIKKELSEYLDVVNWELKATEIKDSDLPESKIIEYLKSHIESVHKSREDLDVLKKEPELEDDEKEKLKTYLPDIEYLSRETNPRESAYRELTKLEIAYRIRWRAAGGEIKKEENQEKQKKTA